MPLSISAVTGADLERRAIGNLTELSRWTPGLTVVDQGARGSNVVIARGLNTDSLNGSEFAGNNYNNGVATYLGDIPLAVDLRLHDIERVEVLLGPQGTLYGAGTLAGAVRYLPRRPDTERRTFEVRGDLFALAHGGVPGSDAGLTFNLPLVLVDARGDTAAGALAPYFRTSPECHQGVNRRPLQVGQEVCNTQRRWAEAKELREEMAYEWTATPR